MGTITIFRFTSASDTPPGGDSLVFNTTSKDTKTVIGIIKDFEVKNREGVGDNQGAEQNLGDQQALGQVERIYVFDGYIAQRDASPNSFLDTLKTWEDGTKTSSTIFEDGRFGIIVTDDTTKNVTPVPVSGGAPQGLIWENIDYKSDFGKNQEKFTLTLRLSKGDGT